MGNFAIKFGVRFLEWGAREVGVNNLYYTLAHAHSHESPWSLTMLSQWSTTLTEVAPTSATNVLGVEIIADKR